VPPPAIAEAKRSLPEYIDYRDRVTTLDHLVAYAIWNANLTGSGYGERLQGLRMSANAFVALGAQPARGRLLAPFDDIVFERTRTDEGVTYVAPSQAAVDPRGRRRPCFAPVWSSCKSPWR